MQDQNTVGRFYDSVHPLRDGADAARRRSAHGLARVRWS